MERSLSMSEDLGLMSEFSIFFFLRKLLLLFFLLFLANSSDNKQVFRCKLRLTILFKFLASRTSLRLSRACWGVRSPINVVSGTGTRDEPLRTSGARKKKTKRKNNNRKPQESNATDQSIVETPEYTTTSVTGNDSPSVNPSQPSAAGQTTKKKVTVIAGDSIVKNVIGSRMGAKDSTNHFVVKPFPGANLSDMEDFVKPLVRKMPDKLILHVGTNDIKSSSPKAIAESTFNLLGVTGKI